MGGAPGERLDLDGTLAVAMSATPSWNGITVVRDCLLVNDNMMWEVEARCAEVRATAAARGEDVDTVPVPTHRNCAARSTVVCTKPLVALFPSRSAHVVREGHMCQPSRGSRKYDAALDRVITSKFRLRKVLAYLDGFAMWQRYARHVLDRTSALHDLSPEMKNEIVFLLQRLLVEDGPG